MSDGKTAADVADHALTQIDKFAAQLSDLAQSQAPVAWALAKGAAQISALSQILYGIGFAIFSGVCFAVVRKLFVFAKRQSDDEIKAVGYGGAVILSIVALISLFITLDYLMDAWPYAGVLHPELWIAHTLLKI